LSIRKRGLAFLKRSPQKRGIKKGEKADPSEIEQRRKNSHRESCNRETT